MALNHGGGGSLFDRGMSSGGALEPGGANLSFGPQLVASPGPTNIPSVVLQAMHAPSMDIYGGALASVTDSLRNDLKRLMRAPESHSFLYIGNGHAAWEAAIANLFSRGDRLLVLETGPFALGWGETAAAMGVEVDVLACEPRHGVDPDAVEDRLKANKDGGEGRFKAVLVAQIDTATSAWSDIAAIRQAIDAADHDALLLVDGVASVGCVPFEMEAWGVDLAMTASQKGLMTPPGLALMSVGRRAWEMRKTAGLRTPYWEWDQREGEVHYQKYCGTPPVQHILGLRRAFDLLLEEEGLEAAWRRHRILGSAVRAAVEQWAEHGAIEFYVAPQKARCDTVTAVRTSDELDAGALQHLAQKHCGVTLGVPIGPIGPHGFRLAHMGHASAASIMAILGVAETAMRSLNWPIGTDGLAAASDVLAKALATTA